ncbi:MAG TPA: hypothetical protein VLE74_04450 [Candidatus Saccharimonadales bacterium]|nr:hypothetical protein [Candidatus Saccharimonadales bacterium]
MAEKLGGMPSVTPEQLDGVTPLFDEPHPLPEGVSLGGRSLSQRAYDIGESVISGAIGGLREFGHELMHGDYSDKFRNEFKQRYRFETSDGVQMTARILNPEYLDSDNPEADDKAIVYSYSLLVPACHGVELPTVAALAAHGEETGRSVIVITTESHSGPMTKDQLNSLSDVWNMPRRRFEVLRQIFPGGKKIMVTGASLGGTMSHAMARTWQKEAQESGVEIEVTHDFAVASAGHFEYSPKHYPRLLRQIFREGKGGIDYLKDGEGWKGKAQRGFEFIGTMPIYPSQLFAVRAISMGLKNAPLRDVHDNIPYDIDVRDLTFSEDELVHSRRRLHMAVSSKHPNSTHEQRPGPHVALLTTGKDWTLRQFDSVTSKRMPAAA